MILFHKKDSINISAPQVNQSGALSGLNIRIFGNIVTITSRQPSVEKFQCCHNFQEREA